MTTAQPPAAATESPPAAPDPAARSGGVTADLRGRVAVVTGASSGLGARFAEVLAVSGAAVFAAARRRERLDALAARVPGVIPVTCDVTRAEDRELLHQAALGETGRVDVLVNNAGYGRGASALDESVAEFEEIIALNLTATFALSVLFARSMIAAGGGSIINIASILGLGAASPASQASYCASKGGVLNLTRELACQWATDGVRVNGIAPGWFPSEVTEEMFSDERSMRWIIRNTPMRRPGRPDELDGALLLLASDASSFITGQTLVVDGGWTSR